MGSLFSRDEPHRNNPPNGQCNCSDEPEVGEEAVEDSSDGEESIDSDVEDALDHDVNLYMESHVVELAFQMSPIERELTLDVLNARGIALAEQFIRCDLEYGIYRIYDEFFLCQLQRERRRPRLPPYFTNPQNQVVHPTDRESQPSTSGSHSNGNADSHGEALETCVNLADNEAREVCASQDDNQAVEVSATQDDIETTEVCATQDDIESTEVCATQDDNEIQEICVTPDDIEIEEVYSTQDDNQADAVGSDLNDSVDLEVHDMSDGFVSHATSAPINIGRPSDDDEYRPQSVSSLRDYFEALSRSFDGNSSSVYYSPSTSMFNETAHSANAETSTVVAQPQDSNDASHEMAGPSGDVNEVEPEVEEDTPDVPKTGGYFSDDF